MNYFVHDSVASRYARYRPYLHPAVVKRIRLFLQLDEPVHRALDVGCGTGHSTVALKEIAYEIVGVDVSAAMLSMAKPEARIRYVQAPAEALPFDDRFFELVTVGLAFHWFDQDRFLAEAHRVLADDGWLVIYNNIFQGHMVENAEFSRWYHETYLARYPTPPRNPRSISREKGEAHGFRLVHEERHEDEHAFTVDQLAAYFTTQSNVIAAVEQGDEDLESVFNWLVESVKPMFPGDSATFRSSGSICYLRKV